MKRSEILHLQIVSPTGKKLLIMAGLRLNFKIIGIFQNFEENFECVGVFLSRDIAILNCFAHAIFEILDWCNYSCKSFFSKNVFSHLSQANLELIIIPNFRFNIIL